MLEETKKNSANSIIHLFAFLLGVISLSSDFRLQSFERQINILDNLIQQLEYDRKSRKKYLFPFQTQQERAKILERIVLTSNSIDYESIFESLIDIDSKNIILNQVSFSEIILFNSISKKLDVETVANDYIFKSYTEKKGEFKEFLEEIGAISFNYDELFQTRIQWTYRLLFGTMAYWLSSPISIFCESFDEYIARKYVYLIYSEFFEIFLKYKKFQYKFVLTNKTQSMFKSSKLLIKNNPFIFTIIVALILTFSSIFGFYIHYRYDKDEYANVILDKRIIDHVGITSYIVTPTNGTTNKESINDSLFLLGTLTTIFIVLLIIIGVIVHCRKRNIS